MRRSKTAGGTETSYVYERGKLIREIRGSEKIDYLYGEDGIIGIKIGSEKYLYRKNVFGDVTEIYDEAGTLVGKYNYNAFGECEIETDEGGIAEKNPIRYRGYYYDEETGFYYLKTRYYDPEIGRFITIDNTSYLNPDGINDLNLYAYCGNNPVMNVDPEGTSWWSNLWNGISNFFSTYGAAIGMSLLAIGGLVVGIVGSVFTGGLVGAIILGAGVGLFTGIAGNLYTQVSMNGWKNIDAFSALKSGVIGAAIGIVSGALSWGFGTLAQTIGKMAGQYLSAMTIGGLNVGKVFAYLGSEQMFIQVGNILGNIFGGIFGGALANKLANNLFGEYPSDEENFSEGFSGTILDYILEFFRWIRV